MLLCAVEATPTALQLVLLVNDPDEAPQFLEGAHFPRSVEPARVLAQLSAWEEFYGVGLDRVVLNQDEPVPKELCEVLGQLHRLEWLEEADIWKVLEAWRSLRPDRRWARGVLMGLLSGSPLGWGRPGEEPGLAAWDWVYVQWRRQVLEVERFLMERGRRICPGHLSPECPLCRCPYGDWDEGPEREAPEGDDLSDVPF